MPEASLDPKRTKDYIKESIWDAIGPPVGDLTWSRRTGAAAMEALWAVAAHCDWVVLEANFRPHSAYERGKLAELDADIIEVYCSCPANIAASRREQVSSNYRPSAEPTTHLPV